MFTKKKLNPRIKNIESHSRMLLSIALSIFVVFIIYYLFFTNRNNTAKEKEKQKHYTSNISSDAASLLRNLPINGKDPCISEVKLKPRLLGSKPDFCQNG
jgi:uncharacterized membrane protein YvbJ